MTSTQLKITNDFRRGLFHAPVDGGDAWLSYEIISHNLIELKKTFVPEDSRNEGVAAELAGKALDFARNEEYKVKPTCNFVQKYLDDNPNYEDLITETN
jgi:hypothetical protein